MTIGVGEAARTLGLTPARVRALIAAGALPARRVGRVHVLDERDVSQFGTQERPAHVRAMAPRIAWAAAALGDGVRPDWIRTDELSRLRARLSSAGGAVGTWRAQLRDIGERRRFRAGPDQVTRLLASPLVVRTGRSATNLVTDALVGPVGASVWAPTAAAANELQRSLGLLPSSTGNVTVGIPATDAPTAWGADGENAYRLIVAVDLLHDGDPRSVSAARALVDAVAREARWAVSGR